MRANTPMTISQKASFPINAERSNVLTPVDIYLIVLNHH
jgi:hypothetical protein